MGVSTALIRASNDYTTSVSYILSEEGGERTILMNPASTSRMTGSLMAKEWTTAVAHLAGMVSTEISQMPLSGVEWLLSSAKTKGVPTVLDVDVPPSVATGSARLGSAEELQRCVRGADVVKLTGSAVEELLSLLSPGARPEGSLEGITQQLADTLGCRLAVITDGGRGSALAVSKKWGGKGVAVRVPCFPGVNQVDATGAGDAFLGGLMAALWHSNYRNSNSNNPSVFKFSSGEDDLLRVGRIASAAGAACVEVVGALPIEKVSAARLGELCEETRPLLEAAKKLSKGECSPGGRNASVSEIMSSDVEANHSNAGKKSEELITTMASSYASDAKALSAGPRVAAQTLVTAIELISRCSLTKRGVAWTTGIGKAGAVAQRCALSLKSIGFRSSFTVRRPIFFFFNKCLCPPFEPSLYTNLSHRTHIEKSASEWAHGDLGALSSGDVVLVFSHSGKTVEAIMAAKGVKAKGASVISVTSDTTSPLAKISDLVLSTATLESDLLGIIPTRSIIAQEALVNSLIQTLALVNGVTAASFRKDHPGGNIGNTVE